MFATHISQPILKVPVVAASCTFFDGNTHRPIDIFEQKTKSILYEVAMKTFVMMTRIAPHDADIIEVTNRLKAHTRTGLERIEAIKKKCPQVRFLAHYALLGPYDFMDVYEAPDEKTAAQVSLLSRSFGAFQIESWTAIPCRELAELAEGLCPDEPSEGTVNPQA